MQILMTDPETGDTAVARSPKRRQKLLDLGWVEGEVLEVATMETAPEPEPEPEPIPVIEDEIEIEEIIDEEDDFEDDDDDYYHADD